MTLEREAAVDESEADPGVEEIEWVPLRRYGDALEAEMARDFLKDHGVRALLRGNNVSTSVMNHVSPMADARLMVAEEDVDQAEEIIRGLAVQARHAYRDPAPAQEIGEDEDADRATRRRRVPFAALPFALVFPIGSGHLYACHYAAGAVFGISILGTTFLRIANGEAWRGYAAIAMVVLDGVLGVRAARAHNEGRVPSPGRQALVAGAIVVACTLAARLFA